MAHQYVNVLTATDSEASAAAMGRALVEQRLAACVQITAIQSVYRWRGDIVDAPEWRLDCKTNTESLERLMAVIRDLHPYEVPEIISTPITAGNSGYLRWIDEETSSLTSPREIWQD